MISAIFDPTQWGLKHAIVIVLALCALNLFGPKGFVHLYYLKKETERNQALKKTLNAATLELELKTKQFLSSETTRKRAIRQHLGYVAPNEISIELPKKLKDKNNEEIRVLR